MFSTLRTRFGIPGVISAMALVFAMFGGAYAAKSGNGDATASDGKATASAKAKAKAKRGPRGPKGATGPAGPAGPQGPAGANGKDGANGANGANGKDGAPGTPGAAGASVEPKTIGAGPSCTFGGSEFIVGTKKTTACNGAQGAQGAQGPKGDPWTVGGTLPAGATETGMWSVTFAGAEAIGTVSFPIPLKAPLDASHVKVVTGTPPAECENAAGPGASSPSNPEAAPGYLCVYPVNFEPSGEIVTGGIADPGAGFGSGAGTSGAALLLGGGAAGGFGIGTFAVTAPTTP
jgi:hypothetical protein